MSAATIRHHTRPASAEAIAALVAILSPQGMQRKVNAQEVAPAPRPQDSKPDKPARPKPQVRTAQGVRRAAQLAAFTDYLAVTLAANPLTWEEFAKKSGCSEGTARNWFAGRALPREWQFPMIAKTLGVPLAELCAACDILIGSTARSQFRPAEPSSLALRLRALLIERGVSVKNFAEQAGMSRYAVSRLISGSAQPGISHVRQLATATGWSCEEIIAAVVPLQGQDDGRTVRTAEKLTEQNVTRQVPSSVMLRRQMELRCISAGELAKLTAISKAVLSQFIRGTEVPPLSTALALASALYLQPEPFLLMCGVEPELAAVVHAAAPWVGRVPTAAVQLTAARRNGRFTLREVSDRAGYAHYAMLHRLESGQVVPGAAIAMRVAAAYGVSPLHLVAASRELAGWKQTPRWT